MKVHVADESKSIHWVDKARNKRIHFYVPKSNYSIGIICVFMNAYVVRQTHNNQLRVLPLPHSVNMYIIEFPLRENKYIQSEFLNFVLILHVRLHAKSY